MEVYKLSMTLCNLATRISITSIKKIDLYITILQHLYLAYIIFEKKNSYFCQKFEVCT